MHRRHVWQFQNRSCHQCNIVNSGDKIRKHLKTIRCTMYCIEYVPQINERGAMTRTLFGATSTVNKYPAPPVEWRQASTAREWAAISPGRSALVSGGPAQGISVVGRYAILNSIRLKMQNNTNHELHGDKYHVNSRCKPQYAKTMEKVAGHQLRNIYVEPKVRMPAKQPYLHSKMYTGYKQYSKQLCTLRIHGDNSI